MMYLAWQTLIFTASLVIFRHLAYLCSYFKNQFLAPPEQAARSSLRCIYLILLSVPVKCDMSLQP